MPYVDVFLIFVLLDFLLELIGGVLFALQAYTSELEYLWVFVKCSGRSSFSFLRHCSPC